jgi:hypothetical protein
VHHRSISATWTFYPTWHCHCGADCIWHFAFNPSKLVHLSHTHASSHISSSPPSSLSRAVPSSSDPHPRHESRGCARAPLLAPSPSEPATWSRRHSGRRRQPVPFPVSPRAPRETEAPYWRTVAPAPCEPVTVVTPSQRRTPAALSLPPRPT